MTYNVIKSFTYKNGRYEAGQTIELEKQEAAAFASGFIEQAKTKAAKARVDKAVKSLVSKRTK